MKIPPLNVMVGIVLSSIGGLLAAASAVMYVRDGWHSAKASGPEQAFHLVTLCLWIVGPPVWFAVELTLLNSTQDKDEVRKKQEVFARIWVGVSAMLGVLASALRTC